MNSTLRYSIFLIFSILSSSLNAQVVADFSMTPPSGCSPLNVSFTDLSTGGATSWNWTLGNGNNSPLQNPGAIYVLPGSYTVCLTASDGVTSDTFCDTVIVFEDPIIDFVADDTAGCANLNVNFTNLSITGTGIASVLWNFGDGNTSNLLNPSHVFADGIFDITLIVTDSSRCLTQGDKFDYIESTLIPIADFSATNTQNCEIPTIVNFTNTSTQDAGAVYTWNFGDVTPISNLQNPTHAYTSSGSYDVELIVEKNACADTMIKLNFVIIQAQDADFSADTTSICIGEDINFTNESVLVANSWIWDFGDGTPIDTAQNPIHIFSTAGTFTVTMTATIPNCEDTETKINFITVHPTPTTSISTDVTDTCSTPFSVNFTSVSSPGVTYDWNFGDGASAVVANPNHVYTSNGNFNISLTVTDVNSCSFTETVNSLINITPPTANFSIDSAFGCVPKTINITDLSTSSNPITSWEWDFGDGTTQLGPNNPSHTYTDTGTYNISLIIIDSFGCTDTLAPGPEVLVGESFNVNFSAVPGVACRVDPISFTNLTDTLFTNDVQWTWFYGDGGTDNAFENEYQYGDTGYFNVTLRAVHNGCASDTTIDSIVRIFPPIALFTPVFDCINLFNVEFQDNSIGPETWLWDINGDSIFSSSTNYTFPDTGTYSATLYVENLTYGCVDSITQEVTIVNPIINFAYDDSIGCPPLNINFSDSSTDALSWFWDFGDGGTSILQNPIYIYNSPGIYDVQLVITSLNGCTGTLFKPQVINALASTPNFVANDTVGCRPFSVDFTDFSSSLGGNVTDWLWSFGDGTTSTNQNPSHTYTDVGNFTVNLQITDSTGCVGSRIKPLYISSTGPIPGFINPTVTCINSLVSFNDTSVSLGGSITNWLWDFGDGTTSTLQNPTHQYVNPGSFDVSLFILDDNGCDSTLSLINTINVDSLTIDFTADSTLGTCPPFIVNFQELVSPSPISWEWDFGNGTTSSVPSPSLVYNSVGSFDVQLIATNTSGCRDTILKPNFITTNGPVGILSSTPDSGCIDLDVQFNVISNNSISQTWDFGDGNVVINNIFNLSHTYTAVSIFRPVVILEDAAGCQFPYSFDSIETGFINADMYIGDNYVCTPDSISFADSTNSTPPVVFWNWNFGDGQTSNQQNPIHNYTSHGVYDIQLIVNNGLCEDTVEILQEVVSDSSTLANFNIISPLLVCPPSEIQFTNTSSADSLISSWDWDFGNGDTSNNMNPSSIIYDTSGVYQISLKITTNKGCTSIFTDSFFVFPLPIFDLGLDTLELCLNTDTIFNLENNGEYTWTPNINLSCADCPDPTIFGQINTTYTINSLNDFGCSYDDTLELIVYELPAFTVSEDIKVTTGTSVDMFAISDNTTDFTWTPNENLTCNNCVTNTFIANETTEFLVTTENEFGCKDENTILVEVYNLCDGSSIFMPNVFTPNNDNLNDGFKATLRENLTININYFRIFDRWGGVVFETADINEAWDGNNPKGNNLNNGVYVYTLDLICPDGSNQILQGNVTLLR